MSNLRWVRLSQQDAAQNDFSQTNTMIYPPEINMSHQLTTGSKSRGLLHRDA